MKNKFRIEELKKAIDKAYAEHSPRHTDAWINLSDLDGQMVLSFMDREDKKVEIVLNNDTRLPARVRRETLL